MTILRSALLVLLATFAVACNRGSAESKAAADTADATRAINQSAPSPLPATTASVAPDGQPVNAMGAAILAFHKHLEAYMKVHNEAEGKVPSLKRTDDPVEISGREKALAEMIMTLRAGAQEGVVFAPDVQTALPDDHPGRFRQAQPRRSRGPRARAAEGREGVGQHGLPDHAFRCSRSRRRCCRSCRISRPSSNTASSGAT